MVEYKPELEKQRWKESLEAAQDELVDSIRQREALGWRIRKLQDDISHLAALCGEEVEEPMKDLGLTDSIRYVLGSKKRMTAMQVRDALVAEKFDISEYKNIMAAIHTVLKRLSKKKEVTNFGNGYIWVGGMTPLPPMPMKLRAFLEEEKLPAPRKEGFNYDKSPKPPEKK
jgi:hypothetical protein